MTAPDTNPPAGPAQAELPELTPAAAAILADAAALDGAGPAAPGAPVAPAAPAPELRAAALADGQMVVSLAASLLLPFLRARFGAELADAYGPQQQRAIVAAYADLAAARGWSLAELTGRWGPELAFAVALLGPAVPFVMARLAKPEPDQAQPAPTRPAEPAPAAPAEPASFAGWDGR